VVLDGSGYTWAEILEAAAMVAAKIVMKNRRIRLISL
jgi:hypothetical protein